MKLTLSSSQTEVPGIQTFYFKPEQPVDYIAGQFLELTIPHDKPDERGIRRWFTLSSSPTEELLAITMRVHDEQSSFKHALQRLQPGESVVMSDLLGDFVLPLDESISLVWIASGIGITPFRSMAKWIADTGEKREITLFHSISTNDRYIFNDIFNEAGIQRRPRWLESCKPTGGSTYYYVSGPERMIKATVLLLQAQSISSQRVITDTFIGY